MIGLFARPINLVDVVRGVVAVVMTLLGAGKLLAAVDEWHALGSQQKKIGQPHHVDDFGIRGVRLRCLELVIKHEVVVTTEIVDRLDGLWRPVTPAPFNAALDGVAV